MARLVLILALVIAGFGSLAIAQVRVGGTYISYGPEFVSMLQLTQTDSGQITGVVHNIHVKKDGRLATDQASVGGVAGDETISLSISLDPFGLFSGRLAGTASGTSIVLQHVEKGGNGATWTFVRGSLLEFQATADRLKGVAQAVDASADTVKWIDASQGEARSAYAWIGEARKRSQPLPRVAACTATENVGTQDLSLRQPGLKSCRRIIDAMASAC